MSNLSPTYELAKPIEPLDHVIGLAAARIVVVEYGDFESALCAQAYPAVEILLKEFERDVRFVFRHFPLVEIHPHAELAAEAAEAASAQGKFWQMHDLLFENQQHLRAKAVRRLAEKLELDLARYNSDMADHVYLQRVQEHLASGHASGVRQSPAFFVDGRLTDVSFGMERLFDTVKARIAQLA